MQLKAIIEERVVPIKVPDFVVQEGESFFAKIDADMDGGWQMGRQWVESPGTVERCQIVAARLLEAVENGDEQMQQLMAGYILARAPGVSAVRIDAHGEMAETELLRGGAL